MFLEWAQTVLTAKGRRLDFDRFPYQREIYRVFADEEVKEAVLMKSVQIGASELLTRLMLFFADTRSLSILYVFPALKQMLDFSDGRVIPLIRNNDYLATRVGDVMNKGLIQIGASHCYLRGSESKNDLIAVDADLLLLDEYDYLSPGNVPEAERRIAASELGLVRRVGVPTEPDFGIARLYEESDQRRWRVRCDRCGKDQTLSFDENVRWHEEAGRILDARIVCCKCKEALDVRKGEWIARYPQRATPGFHVHRLMVRHADLTRLIESSKKRQPHLAKIFFNNDLGLPYAEQSHGLDRTSIAAAISAGTSFNGGVPMAMVQGYNGNNVVTAGIDVASARALTIRISEHLDPPGTRGRKRALFVGSADTFYEVAQILDRYNVHLACIDAAPEERSARGLAAHFPGRVYLTRYATQLDPIRIDRETRLVSVRRTGALDAMIEVMRSLRNLLPADLPSDYVEQMIAVRRTVTRDSFDRTVVSYESRGADDYFHAEVYDLLATEVVRDELDYQRRVQGEGELIFLDDYLDYPRSNLSIYDEEPEYSPGPPDEYRSGFDEDFDEMF